MRQMIDSTTRRVFYAFPTFEDHLGMNGQLIEMEIRVVCLSGNLFFDSVPDGVKGEF